MNWNYIVTPIVGAIIGWGTNYVAVKMLFRPRNEVKFLGLKFQGIFPKRQLQLAEKISEIVATELVGFEQIEHLKSNLTSEKLTVRIDVALDSFIKNRLLKLIPMASMFLSDDMVSKFKSFFISDLNAVVEEILDENSEAISSLVNLKETVREKVANFSSEKLEAIILEVMKKELVFVEYVGGILGFLVGLIQVVIFAVLN